MARSGVRTSLYRLADERLDGRLGERIAELRAESLSWSHVAMELAVESGLRLTPETLRTWARQLGIDTEKAAS